MPQVSFRLTRPMRQSTQAEMRRELWASVATNSSFTYPTLPLPQHTATSTFFMAAKRYLLDQRFGDNDELTAAVESW